MVDDNITIDEASAQVESDEVYGMTWTCRSNVSNGKKREIRDHDKTWMHDERCETCSHWTVDIPSAQPPDGWGVYGFCSALTAANHKEYRTESHSYCEYYQAICKKMGKYAISRLED